MSHPTIEHYHQYADRYQAQYDSVSTANVHAAWLPYLTERLPGRALDVGAGAGRDALWLAQQGWQVTAVEPAKGLRELGQRTTGDHVDWVNAQLPMLSELQPPAEGYDLILLSAVWMHLTSSERSQAFSCLSALLSNTGFLVITLRFGPPDPARPMYPVNTAELAQLARQSGFQSRVLDDNTTDQLQRSKVSWKTVLIERLSESAV